MIELQKAGPVTFLRTLLILVCIYYGLKFLAKLFAPYLLNKFVEKMQDKAHSKFGGKQREENVKEGQTIIDKTPQKNNNKNDSLGEYVDFEEID